MLVRMESQKIKIKYISIKIRKRKKNQNTNLLINGNVCRFDSWIQLEANVA